MCHGEISPSYGGVCETYDLLCCDAMWFDRYVRTNVAGTRFLNLKRGIRQTLEDASGSFFYVTFIPLP